MIGVLVPHLQSDYYITAIDGIQEYAASKGIQMLLSQSGNTRKGEEAALQKLYEAGAEGIIAALSMETEDASHFRLFRRQDIPLAFFHHVRYDIPAIKVVIDHFDAGYQATRHLIDGGSRRIALITGPLRHPMFSAQLEGFQEALHEKGLTRKPEYVHSIGPRQKEFSSTLKKLLSLSEPPDGLIAPDPFTAIQAASLLRMHHIAVPNEFTLMSMGDSPVNSLYEPSISALHFPARETGRSAAMRVIENMQSGNSTDETLIKPSRLLIRQSSLKNSQ